MDMKSVSVFQVGMRRRYIEAIALQKAGRLNFLYTDFWLRGGKEPWYLPNGVSRFNENLNETNVKSANLIGLMYPIIRRLVKKKKNLDKLHYLISKIISKIYFRQIKKSDILYAYSGEAIHFKELILSKDCELILDQKGMPRSYYREIYEKEIGDKNQFWKQIELNERIEWSLAKSVLCGSQAVKNALVTAGCDEIKIKIIPSFYPKPLVNKYSAYTDGILKVLYVGNIHPMKGIKFILDAAKLLEVDCEFTLMVNVKVDLII